MPNNLKMFEWSAYGSIIISLLAELACGPQGELISVVVVYIRSWRC
jgi:hypothetical protein